MLYRSHIEKRERIQMAKVVKRAKWRVWTKENIRELKTCSRSKMPVVEISKLTKRTVGALRRKAREMGIRIGHRR